jgi:phosphohistidine swiveling domain-containing protein
VRYVFRFGGGVEPPDAPAEILGGKGRSLVDLIRYGFDVPPGFIVSTECCRQRPPGLEAEIREGLAWLEGVEGRRLGEGLRAAVRSGAPVSMPGMMDTVLDVDSWPALIQAVEKVFASWESDRARSYRARHGLNGLAGTAAVVQAMFPSERAGVIFTEDPARPDEGRIVIEAAAGLGEAVVGGAVEPDRWVVDRSTRSVLEGRAEACLTEGQVRALADLGLRIEAHSGAPVDVEWGLAGGRIVALQARPIRGLDVARAAPRVREREIARLAARRARWVVSNLAETLPAPTPLTWDLIGRRLMRTGIARMYADLGFAPSKRVREEGFLELICGRVYADLERSAELFFGPTPLEYDPSIPDALSRRPTRFNLEKAGARFLLALPVMAWRMARAARRIARAGRDCVDEIRSSVFPRLDAWLREAPGRDLAEIEAAVLDDFGPELLKPGFLAAHYHSRLSTALEEAFGPDEGRRLTAGLLSGLDDDRTVELNQALFERDLESFLAEFGHRAVNEFELSEPRWREDPTFPLRRIEQFRRGGPSPRERHEERRRARAELEAALTERLRVAGASSLEAGIRADLAAAQRFASFRETCKDRYMRALAELRRAIEAAAARRGLGRDVYFLGRDELESPPAGLAERRIEWEAARRIALPDAISSHRAHEIGSAAAAGSLEGVGVSLGAGAGPAAVLADPADAPELAPGYVLVCPSTDPGWTPLLAHAAALVVERGGMLSHGAIVARDFGIPAVVLPGATRTIPAGRRVRVDGGTGRVEML